MAEAKVHLHVTTMKGSSGWCGQHARYSLDVMEPGDFKNLPDHRQCKRCAKAFPPAAALTERPRTSESGSKPLGEGGAGNGQDIGSQAGEGQ